MIKNTCQKIICFFLLIVFLAARPVYAEKIGILFLHVGETEHFRPDSWQFFRNLYDVMPPGFFAGSDLEGGDCYTMIHYADEVQAATCALPPGTPIDSLCNEYAGAYEVRSILERGPLGERSFRHDCYPGIFPYVFHLALSTKDPLTGVSIPGPHVDDPEGSGRGIPDFIELVNFMQMYSYTQFPDGRNPHQAQLLRWWYGTDAGSDRNNKSAVQTLLSERLPDTAFVFRHGWEFYMRNRDIYGNPFVFPDSTETALKELIVDEGVNKVVVVHTYPSFSNLTQYGHEWYDADGRGISAVEDATFRECVEDLSNGVGPKTSRDLQSYLMHKPWETHGDHPFPLTLQIAREIDQSAELIFAPAYGGFSPFGEAVRAKVHHTISRHSIPDSAALKIILIHHGYAGGFADAQECDCYNQEVDVLFKSIQNIILDSLSRSGRVELVHAAAEYAEGDYDPATWHKPFGNVLSFGEHVDMAINGTYVNQRGRRVDNGNDNFDYIVAIPYFYDAESAETLLHMRDPLGNFIPGRSDSYVRDTRNADGQEHSPFDLDEEFTSVHVFDGSGWPSTPRWSRKTVYKGSPEKPTTLILTGAMLSTADDGTVQTKMSQAVVSAIENALSDSALVTSAEKPMPE